MSHQPEQMPEQMPEDMAIDLWLQTLNDELNEMLARDGRDDVTDLLQQRYSILKRLAIASVKREPLSEFYIYELWEESSRINQFARLIEQAHGIGATTDSGEKK